jgi:hypothetical protein
MQLISRLVLSEDNRFRSTDCHSTDSKSTLQTRAIQIHIRTVSASENYEVATLPLCDHVYESCSILVVGDLVTDSIGGLPIGHEFVSMDEWSAALTWTRPQIEIGCPHKSNPPRYRVPTVKAGIQLSFAIKS